MVVSNNSNISFPAYLSMMNGVYTDYCRLNQPTAECRRSPVETLPERLLREKQLAIKDAAVFASWDRIADASVSRAGSIVTNAGPVTFEDPAHPGAHDDINARMKADLVRWHYDNGERPDRYTMEHALTYLKNNRPRFLWIYLVETDEYAHANNYPRYISAISENEARLLEVMETLKQLGDYGAETSIILTTDHGRGEGPSGWMHHGVEFSNSRHVWAYIWGPRTPGLGSVPGTHYSHVNLRPTMEALLGLVPLHEAAVVREALR